MVILALKAGLPDGLFSNTLGLGENFGCFSNVFFNFFLPLFFSSSQ
jgi:hypothetical protein